MSGVISQSITEATHRFVERRYRDGDIDWLWVRRPTVQPTDVDCTELSEEQLAERIRIARGRTS